MKVFDSIINTDWSTFYNKIKMYRTYKDFTAIYIGRYTDVSGHVYEAEFEVSKDLISDSNDTDLSYIDSFVKEQIADKLALEINEKAEKIMKNVQNSRKKKDVNII